MRFLCSEALRFRWQNACKIRRKIGGTQAYAGCFLEGGSSTPPLTHFLEIGRHEN